MLRRLDPVVLRPDFLVALLLLALNDHVWKAEHPGLLTGKLSDVAGLYAFGLFWTALFPHHRRAVLATIALGFAGWKSPLSQPLLDAWNARAAWPMHRVVDATDLLALAVLPLVRVFPTPTRQALRSAQTLGMSLVAVAVFGGTQFAAEVVKVEGRYPVARELFDVVRQDSTLAHYPRTYWIGTTWVGSDAQCHVDRLEYPRLVLGLGVQGCGEMVRDGAGTWFRLDSVATPGGFWGWKPGERAARRQFEEEVMDDLHAVPREEWVLFDRCPAAWQPFNQEEARRICGPAFATFSACWQGMEMRGLGTTTCLHYLTVPGLDTLKQARRQEPAS